MGAQLLLLWMSAPGALQRWREFTLNSTCATGSRDALPLHTVGLSEEDRRKIFELATGHLEDDQQVILGRRCWTLCLALGLNALHGGILQPPRDTRHGASGPVSGEIWNYLEKVADDITKQGDLDLGDFDAGSHFKSKQLDYNGDIISKPIPLTLAQVRPALPPEGLGGCVEATDFAEGYIKEILLDPELVMYDREAWPAVKPTKIHASDQEWQSIGEELLRRGIVEEIADENLIRHGGQILTCGAFGVPKPGKEVRLENGELGPVLRLVINMVPQNQLQETVDVGLDELPYFGQWIPIELENDQSLVWSSEDIRCAFYIFRMPQPWR
eukprot:6490663-Amphidinium_carterae.4